MGLDIIARGLAAQAQTYAAAAEEAKEAAEAAAAAAEEAARTLTIDPTLTEQGEAADAKAAGDAIHATQSMIAGRESSSTATRNYSVGDLVIVGDVLYRVTAAIASGETITPGTNVTTDTVSAELAALGSGKADKDGTYEDLTAGNAEQIVTDMRVTNKVPYTFRTAGGGLEIGDRAYIDKIVGGTVAWNQLIRNGNFVDSSGWSAIPGEVTSASYADNTATITYTGSNTTGNSRLYRAIKSIGANHVIMICGSFLSSVDTQGTCFALYSVESNIVYTPSVSVPANKWTRVSVIVKTASNLKTTPRCYFCGNKDYMANGDSYSVRNANVFDLTQKFGSAIADHIYALETANEGAGIAWFRALFPADYYAYDAGTLRSVNAAAHKTVGFNAWDEDWELGAINSSGEKVPSNDLIRSKNYIPIIPGTTYYANLSGKNARIAFYDAGMAFISYVDKTGNGTFTTPENACYMLFRMNTAYGTTYNHNICFNLSWDGERDGEYEPYSAHTYALDDALTLLGVPALDADNNLVYDGDEYAPDGTVTRRYGIVDLGTLSWNYSTAYANPYFYAVYVRQADAKNGAKMICQKYPTYTAMSGSEFGATEVDKVLCAGVNANAYYIKIRDTEYTDADTFASAMSGVYLAYELATPTTEAAAPYQETQICSNWGTEEYTDAGVVAGTRDVAIPVGHVTEYPPNLRAKLEAAPDSPGADGVYLMKRENGVNSYIAYLGELPADPTEDGTYTLKCTVSSGTATKSWVSES